MADAASEEPHGSTLDAVSAGSEPNPDDCGPFTDQLSDLTDDDDGATNKISKSKQSWYRRLQPLLGNTRIRNFAITNCTLLVLNVVLVLALVVAFAYAIVLHSQVVRRSQMHKPCIFEWTEWSTCSASCRAKGQPYPYRTRRVNADKIVHARGRFAEIAPCPSNLTTKIDFAPCNTHYCPVNLSSFNFSANCFRRDPHNPRHGCYRIRDVPFDDQLIHIDTDRLTTDANCVCLSDNTS